MPLEIKILLYWLILTILFYIGARIQYYLDNLNVKFEYYDGVFKAIYNVLLIIGFVTLSVYTFVQITNFVFKGYYLTF